MSQFRCPTPSIQRWKAETHLEVIDVYVRPREPFCELCKGPSYCPAPTLSDFVGYKVAVFAPRIVVMGSFRVLSKTLGSLGISAMTNEGSLNRKLESPRRYTRTFFSPASLATELALNHTESGDLETGIHWNFASSRHIRRPKHCLSGFASLVYSIRRITDGSV